MKRILLGLLGLMLLGAVYTAWPLYSMYAAYSAFRNDDAVELDARVDFDSLRESLRPQLQARMGGRAGASASPVAMSMMNAMLDGLSAEAVIAAKGGALQRLLPAEGDGTTEGRDLEWAFFTSPTRFEIATTSGSLALRLDGATWRLYEVTLPPAPAPAPRAAPTPVDVEDLGLQPLEGLEALEDLE